MKAIRTYSSSGLLVLLLSCSILFGFAGIAIAEDNIQGWAVIKGYKNRLSHWQPEEGNRMILIETQLKNEGSEMKTVEIGSIQLKDSEGYTYTCRTGMISEKFSSFDHLLPGEVLWYTLGYEVPPGVNPDQLIVNFSMWGEGSSKRIPIKDKSPDSFLKSTYNAEDLLNKDETATLCGIEITPTLEVSDGELSTTFTLNNITSDVVKFGMDGCSLLNPFVKGSYGKYASSPDTMMGALPSDIQSDERLKMDFSFNVTNIEPPYYLFIGEGVFSDVKKLSWEVRPAE